MSGLSFGLQEGFRQNTRLAHEKKIDPQNSIIRTLAIVPVKILVLDVLQLQRKQV